MILYLRSYEDRVLPVKLLNPFPNVLIGLKSPFNFTQKLRVLNFENCF